MAAHRPFLRHAGALAIFAAAWALALLVVAGVAAAPGVVAGHSFCVAAPVGDGTPPAHPEQGPGCDSCLVCQQQRGFVFLGLAFAPPAARNIPRGEVAAEPVVSLALTPERRAGRGGGSSRAPPVFG